MGSERASRLGVASNLGPRRPASKVHGHASQPLACSHLSDHAQQVINKILDLVSGSQQMDLLQARPQMQSYLPTHLLT
eukprot:6211479-Pleurochrysis_carterae.AAC.1